MPHCARVAAACSAALVFVTVCALVALRSAAPKQPGATTAPVPTEMTFPSCDDQCRVALSANGYIIGTAPLCDGSCMDCGYQDLCFWADPIQRGYGQQCKSGTKVCCCASNTNLTKAPVPPPAPVGSLRCADFCAEGGFGYGMVIGTAPFCESECSYDCDGKCSIVTDFFSDQGDSCLTGAKRCCCARKTAAAEPTPRMPDHPSCNDWCLSADYARGDMKGTAPACNGTCDGARACFTASNTLSDYGDACSLGGIKKCRCW